VEEGGGGWDEYLPEPGCEPFFSSSPTVRRLQRGGLMGPEEGMQSHAEWKWYRVYTPSSQNGGRRF